MRDEQEIIRTGQPLVNVEEKETLPTGEFRWVSTTKLPLRDRQGNIVGTFGISRDITERKKAGEQLQHQAFYDPLTDLPNRALFLDRLQHLFHRARRSLGNPRFAVLYLDLDRFKAINDSLGHQVGDEVLSATARRLERCIRPGDTLARLGGDEFTILLDDVRSEADATGVAERIHQEVAAPLEVQGVEVFTSVSVGIALSSAGYECPEDMLRDADTAMYRAKMGGRARHQVFTGDMHQRAVSSLRLETDLRRALERREIVPFYQPVVDLDTGAVVGFEALARWRHPSRGLLLPDLFIPVAEETGLVVELGEWMLAEACRQAREWQRRHPLWSKLGISVNVSGRQISQPGLAAEVERVLGATGLDPTCLTLEITESALMHNLNAGASVVQRLHAMSVGLHLDDFGTGYSSLAYLHSFPVQALKVDRSFVNRMDRAAPAGRDRQGDRLARPRSRDGGGRRGGRDARAGRGPPRAPLRARARIPLLGAAPRGPGGTAPHQRPSDYLIGRTPAWPAPTCRRSALSASRPSDGGVSRRRASPRRGHEVEREHQTGFRIRGDVDRPTDRIGDGASQHETGIAAQLRQGAAEHDIEAGLSDRAQLPRFRCRDLDDDVAPGSRRMDGQPDRGARWACRHRVFEQSGDRRRQRRGRSDDAQIGGNRRRADLRWLSVDSATSANASAQASARRVVAALPAALARARSRPPSLRSCSRSSSMMAAVSAASAMVAPGAPARARALDTPCTKLLMSCATAPARSLVQAAALGRRGHRARRSSTERGLVVDVHQVVGERVSNEVGASAQPQFLGQPRAVGFDALHADGQPLRDLLVREAQGQVAKHPGLARAQSVEGRFGPDCKG